ncbi:AAA family ATPase [Lentisphaerota bacterium WC36G]|nr:AAA family ATPase [Lentisphaerae bacterium WC36]
MNQVTINSLEIENVKRIKAIKIAFNNKNLTVIGGNNAQGKTTVLDTICWALGGNKFAPSNPKRDGSVVDPSIKLTLSNGLIVERKGKNSSLKVTDPSGNKGGQQLLNSFVEELALNLPKFMNANNKEKANILLRTLGIESELRALDDQEQKIYNERHLIGQDYERKRKYAEELPHHENVPPAIITANELIEQQQKILLVNAENAKQRTNLANNQEKLVTTQNKITYLQEQLKAEQELEQSLLHNIEIGQKTVEELQDQSTEAIAQQIEQIDTTNTKIRANLDKDKALIDAENLKKDYDDKTTLIQAIRDQRMELLKNANLPLEGLLIDNGELVYNSQKWDCMSSSEQMIVATAIVKSLNPECGFVLLDKLEQLDKNSLDQFAKYLEEQGLQVIATRVANDDSCTIIIDDGEVIQDNTPKKAISNNKFAGLEL